VYIHNEERVGVKYARYVLDEGEQNGGFGIVISTDGPTPFTRRECEGKRIQFFLARDLYVNIVDHCLVPKHEAVSEPPSGVKKEELPCMESTDKIAQYYDWTPGTIVKITRVFGGHEPIPYYRVIVPVGTT
jgi:DNA-directed RNA polymerase subunit H (RpoH/RPB5)